MYNNKQCKFGGETLTRDYNIYSIDELIMKKLQYMFLPHNWIDRIIRSPEDCLKLERWHEDLSPLIKIYNT